MQFLEAPPPLQFFAVVGDRGIGEDISVGELIIEGIGGWDWKVGGGGAMF